MSSCRLLLRAASSSRCLLDPRKKKGNYYFTCSPSSFSEDSWDPSAVSSGLRVEEEQEQEQTRTGIFSSKQEASLELGGKERERGPEKMDIGSFPRQIVGPLSSNLDRADETELTSIVSRTIAVLCRRAPASEGDTIVETLRGWMGDASAKEVYASLSTVLIDAARQDLTEEQVASALKENGVDGEMSRLIGKSFAAGKGDLRWMLQCTAIGQLTLIDFEWRLDYHVRSSATGIEHVPVYFVSMKTKSPDGEYGQKDFTCSHEQMQDMLSTVRDAIKNVERLSSSKT